MNKYSIKRLLENAVLGALVGLSGCAVAGTNEYGGYDIIETAAMFAEGYGTTRGWQVMAAFEGKKFAFCYAEPENEPADSRVRIGWDSRQWQVAVPIRAKREWEGTLEIDGRGAGNGGGTQTRGTSAGGRAIAWLGLSEVEAVGNGNRAVVGIGKQDFDFSLAGANAAMLKIEECVERRGKQGAKDAQAEPEAGSGSNPRKQALGKVGGFEIARYTKGGKLAYCEAVIITGTETGLRITLREDGASFGFAGYGSSTLGNRATVKHWIDGDKSSAATGDASLELDASGFEWMMISEGNDQPGMFDDALPNARTISFAYKVDGQEHVETFPLKSSNKTVTRLLDCRDGR